MDKNYFIKKTVGELNFSIKSIYNFSKVNWGEEEAEKIVEKIIQKVLIEREGNNGS